jgi:endogenous inhibitor of DNA gyrase (YacG/DUF329 family)
MASDDQARPCVICGKPQVERLRPFCSRRCADIDLHRWLSGVYSVPAQDDEAPENGDPTDET